MSFPDLLSAVNAAIDKDHPSGPPAAEPAPTPPDLHEAAQSVIPLPGADANAQIFGLSKSFGETPQAVFDQKDKYVKAALAPTRDEFDVVSRNYPVTSAFLSDREQMAQAYDDVPNAVAHEHINKKMTEANGYLEAIEAGVQGSIRGMLTRNANPDIAVGPNAPFGEKFASQATQFAMDFPFMVASGAVGSAVAAPAGPIVAGLAGMGASFALPDAYRTALREHFENGDSDSAADLLMHVLSLNSLKAGAKGFATGVLTGTAGAVFSPLGRIASTAAEIGTMTAAPAAMEGKAPKLEDIAQGALLVALTHGVEHAGGYTLDRAFPKRVIDEIRMRVRSDAAARMDETSRASLLRKRNKGLFEKLLSEHPDVLVNVAAYESLLQQDGKDPGLFSNDLGVSLSHEFARQAGDGNYIHIPQGKWLSVEMDPYRAKLADDITFNQDHATRNEAKKADEAVAENIKATMEASDAAIKAEPARKEVYDAIQKQTADLLAENGIDEKQAKANSQIVAAHYTAESVRRGQGESAQQIYDREFPTLARKMFGVTAEGAVSQTPEPLHPGQEPRGGRTAGFQAISPMPRSSPASGPVGQGSPASGAEGEASEFASYDPTVAGNVENFKALFGGDSLGGPEHPAELLRNSLLTAVGSGKSQDEAKQERLTQLDITTPALIAAAKSPGFDNLPEKTLRHIADSLYRDAMYRTMLTGDHPDAEVLAAHDAMRKAVNARAPLEQQASLFPPPPQTLHQEPSKALVPIVMPAPQIADASYSKLIQTLEQKIQGKSATVEQVRALASGFKEDERKWTGFDKFMEGKSGKIDKAELIDFLNNNRFQVEERVLGERTPELTPEETKALALPEGGLAQFKRWAAGHGYSESALEGQWARSNRDEMTPLVRQFSDDHPELTGAMTPNDAEARRNLIRRAERMVDERIDEKVSSEMDAFSENDETGSHYATEVENDDERSAGELTDEELTARGAPPIAAHRDLSKKSKITITAIGGKNYETEGFEPHPGLIVHPSILDADTGEFSTNRYTVSHKGSGLSGGNKAKELPLEQAFMVADHMAAVPGTDWTIPIANEAIGGSGRAVKDAIAAGYNEYESEIQPGEPETKWQVMYDRGGPVYRNEYFDTQEEAQEQADNYNQDERDTAYNEHERQFRNDIDRDEIVQDVYDELGIDVDNNSRSDDSRSKRKEFTWDDSRHKSGNSSYTTGGAIVDSERDIVFHAKALEKFASDSLHMGDVSSQRIGWMRTSLHYNDGNIIARLVDENQNDRTQKGADVGFDTKEGREAHDAWRDAGKPLYKARDEAQEAASNLRYKINMAYRDSQPPYVPVTELPAGYNLTHDSDPNQIARGREWGVSREGGSAQSITGVYHATEKEAIDAAITRINEDAKYGRTDSTEFRTAQLNNAERNPEYRALKDKEIAASAAIEAHDALEPKHGNVPDTPFKNTWHEFQWKRFLRWHIEQDYKKWQARDTAFDKEGGTSFVDWWKDNGIKTVAWTTGMMQAERNRRVDDVDKLVYDPVKQELSAFKGGRNIIDGAKMKPEEIAEKLGGSPQAHEIVKRLLATEPEKVSDFKPESMSVKQTEDQYIVEAPGGKYKVDIGKGTVGSEQEARDYAVRYFGNKVKEQSESGQIHPGMHVIHDEGGIKVAANADFFRNLYDVKIPSFLKQFGKQWGATVGEVMLRTGDQITQRYEGPEPSMRQLEAAIRATAASGPNIMESPVTGERQQFPVNRVSMQEQGKVLLENMKAGQSFKDAMNGSSAEFAAMFGGGFAQDHASRYEKFHALNITPEMANAAIMQGFPLFQGENDPRGEYVPSLNAINLGKDADASTYMHEFFHGALKHMFEFSKSGQATEDYLNHFKSMADFLGIKDDQTELTRDQQEKGARAFERYLRGEDSSEGGTKAPSAELRGAFAMFRGWLTQVYRQIAGSEIAGELSPDAHAFFDRMLATDDQIEAAQRDVGYKPSEIQDIPSADPAISKRIRTLQERAHEIAVKTLLDEQMAEMREDNKAVLEKERARLTGEITPQVAELPVHRAGEDLQDEFGKKQIPADYAKNFLDGKANDHEQAQFEAIAELNGFQDGNDMAKQIVAAWEAGGQDAEVKKRVEAGMAPLADLRDTDAIRQRAIEVIHNTRSTELLALERQALEDLQHKKEIAGEVTKRRRNDAALEAAQVKEQARALLASKPVGEAGAYRPYLTAERKAAVRVSQALAKEDYAGAAKAKRDQMMNHALAAEAIRNRAEIGRTVKFLKKFGGRGGDLLKMPYGFVHQIDDLLSSRGLSEAKSGDDATLLQIAKGMAARNEEPADIANATSFMRGDDGKWRKERLADFVARVNDNYYALTLPDSVMQRPQADTLQQAARNLTLGDLRDVRDTVKAISGIGKEFESFLNSFIKSDIKTAGGEIASHIKARLGAPRADELKPGHTYDAPWKEFIAGLKNRGETFFNDQKTLLTLCNILDGGDPDGPMKKYVYYPLKEAYDNRDERTIKYRNEINELLGKYYKPRELAAYKNQNFQFEFSTNADGSLRTWKKDELLAMARNWGNLGNRDRIMRGFGLDETQVNSMLQNLSKKDWDANQAIFDHLQTYWPDIVKQEMKVQGFEPHQVEAAKITTPYGEYAGGYYPIKYDFEKSIEASRNEVQKNELFKQMSAAAAHTDKGHVQTRVNTLSRPIRLSSDVLINHIENVNHDLAFRETVIDTARLLRRPEVREAIQGAIGMDGLKTIEDHLRAVASDQGNYVDGAESALKWFRYKATLATLSVRPFIFPLRFGGDVLNTVSELGPTGVLSAMHGYWTGNGTRETVDSKSVMMRNFSHDFERDVFDVSNAAQGQTALGGAKKLYLKYAFAADTFADQIMRYPMWLHIYQSEIAQHGDERKAVDHADAAITRTFGSGRSIDRVEAQRGSEWQKSTTMYMSYSTMMFNRWLNAKGVAASQYFMDRPGAAAATLIKAATFTFVLPALYDTFVREAMHNVAGGSSEDPEEKKKRLLASAIAAPFGNIWIARDFAPVIVKGVMGVHGRHEFKASPMEDAAQTVLDAATDSAKGDPRAPELTAKAASYLLGYPQEVNALVYNYLDWLKGNGELTWRDILTHRSKR